MVHLWFTRAGSNKGRFVILHTLNICWQGTPIRFVEEQVHEDGVVVMRLPDDFISNVSPGFLATFAVLIAFEYGQTRKRMELNAMHTVGRLVLVLNWFA